MYRIWISLGLILILSGCLTPHRRQERRIELLIHQWKQERQDDCNYLNWAEREDCVKRSSAVVI